MLHPRLRDPAALAALRDRWQTDPCLRIDGFLDDAEALALRDAVRLCPHELQMTSTEQLMYQYWAFAQVPDAACDHVVCRAGRWLWTEGAAWLSALTGIPLVAPADRQLIATHYDKGSYLDPHNDADGTRKVAYVLGLTEGTSPAEDGGWLEFLGSEADGATVVERRPPGWNTLDLFDVRAQDRTHAVPIVTRRLERRALSGWFY